MNTGLCRLIYRSLIIVGIWQGLFALISSTQLLLGTIAPAIHQWQRYPVAALCFGVAASLWLWLKREAEQEKQ